MNFEVQVAGPALGVPGGADVADDLARAHVAGVAGLGEVRPDVVGAACADQAELQARDRSGEVLDGPPLGASTGVPVGASRSLPSW